MTDITRIMVGKAGPAAALAIETAPMPQPGADKVLIAVEAGGVAFADIMLRLGIYPGFRPPVTPGYDVIGRVVALGSGVSSFSIGQRVAAMLIVGGYATHVVADENWIVPAPEHVPAEVIAAAILNYTTAYQMLTRCAQVEAGDTVLVHGAGGGVGTALLDLVRHMGARAYGTASKGKHEAIAAFGATPIDYRADDFVTVVRGSGGVQAVFDHVGGAHLNRSIKALRPSGKVVSYGAYGVLRNGRISLVGGLGAVASRLKLDPLAWLRNSQSVIGYGIGVERDSRNRAFRTDFSAVMSLLEAGAIQPTIDSVFTLAEAAKAQQKLERAGATGKIVLTMRQH